ncbi:MAG: hypothetical protein WDA60_17405 [Acidimicrobiia bacterium]
MAAVVVLAGGCGGGGGTASVSAGFIARAAASTDEQESARIAMTMDVDGRVLEGDGVIALDGSALEMTFSVPGQGEIEERLVDRMLYMRMPGAAAEVGTTWISMDLDGMLPEQQADARASNGGDPSSTLDALRGANGDVETLGRDELRGGPATHYRVRLDAQAGLERAKAQFPGPLSDEQIEAIRNMDGEPVDVWIDDDGRVLQERFTVTMPQGRVRMTMELYDFGVRADVQAPPASDTTDYTDRMRGTATA